MDYSWLLDDVFFVLLFGGVTMLEVMAALYLLLRRGNAIAPEVNSPVRLRRWTAAFMAVSVLSHVCWVLGVFHPIADDPDLTYLLVSCLDIGTILPTMAGVMLSMLQDRRRPVWPAFLVLLPVAVFAALYMIRPAPGLAVPVYIVVLALTVLLFAWLAFTVRRYGRWLRDNYADLEHKEVWHSLLVLAVFLVFFFLYEIAVTPFLLYALQMSYIALTVLLLLRVENLQELNPETEQELCPEEKDVPVPAPVPIPPTIGPLLQKHCEEGGLYLQHDLTLAQLAQAIGTNRYYLSQYFARLGLTYNAYINGLRIRHFTRLYHDAVSDKRIVTAQQLAFESGFHSYSTFGAAFKQIMGTTVTAWMRAGAQ